MLTENPFTSNSETSTREWAGRFASRLKPGDIIGLEGGLGSGKTMLCKGICQGLGFKGLVNSPTYSLVHEYESEPKIIHMDFYRITDSGEHREIGLDYYLNSGGICLIEWPEKIRDYPLNLTHTLSINEVKEGVRRISYQIFSQGGSSSSS